MSWLFDALQVWYDELPKTGAENMAVDQLLAEQGCHEAPVLRVYHWSEPTVSFGYSLRFSDAEKSYSGGELVYVRRWTGGGVVDHRNDLTYTLAVPRWHKLATMRGAENYAAIHRVLAKSLCEAGQDVSLALQDLGDGDVSCFQNPVAYDIVNASSQKIAGAGQRRTRHGLLHQGSLIADVDAGLFTDVLARNMSRRLSEYQVQDAMLEESCQLAKRRYATKSWLRKR